MNIENNINKNPKINFASKQQAQQELDTKDAIKILRKIVAQNLDDNSNFAGIVAFLKFNNPNLKKEFNFIVERYSISKKEFETTLKIASDFEDDTLKTMILTSGSKQDILDYLGNEKKLDEINLFMEAIENDVD